MAAQRVGRPEGARHEPMMEEPLGGGFGGVMVADAHEQEVGDRGQGRPAGRGQAIGETLTFRDQATDVGGSDIWPA